MSTAFQSMGYILVVDLTRQNSRFELFDKHSGQPVLQISSVPSSSAIDTIVDRLEQFMRQARVDTTNVQAGVCISNDRSAIGAELVKLIRERLYVSCKLIMEGDAVCAAEMRWGAGMSPDARGEPITSMVYLNWGMTIFGGLMLHGKIVPGFQPEHIVVHSQQGRTCLCGRPGHLEAYASTDNIVEMTASAVAASKNAWQRRLPGETFTYAQLLELVSDGKDNPHVSSAFNEAAQAVGLAIASLLSIHPAIQCVVVGGVVEMTQWVRVEQQVLRTMIQYMVPGVQTHDMLRRAKYPAFPACKGTHVLLTQK